MGFNSGFKGLKARYCLLEGLGIGGIMILSLVLKRYEIRNLEPNLSALGYN